MLLATHSPAASLAAQESTSSATPKQQQQQQESRADQHQPESNGSTASPAHQAPSPTTWEASTSTNDEGDWVGAKPLTWKDIDWGGLCR